MSGSQGVREPGSQGVREVGEDLRRMGQDLGFEGFGRFGSFGVRIKVILQPIFRVF